MASEVFNSFRLVGGTALSLQLEHLESVDIDLFTDYQTKNDLFEAESIRLT